MDTVCFGSGKKSSESKKLFLCWGDFHCDEPKPLCSALGGSAFTFRTGYSIGYGSRALPLDALCPMLALSLITLLEMLLPKFDCWDCFSWKLFPSTNRHWRRSLETLDSEADLRSSAFFTGSGHECGNCSSPMSRAMTLGDRRCLSPSSAAASAEFSNLFADKIAAFVRISLG